MKKISILGSTGSIGKQTLDVVREHKDKFEVIAISANSSVDLLLKQIKEFKPKSKEGWIICLSDLIVSIGECERFQFTYAFNVAVLLVFNIILFKN